MNPLLATDVYKLGHMEQYPEGTEYIYSYLQARSDKLAKETVFFGLQYYLMEYLSAPITQAHADEFFAIREAVLGPTPDRIRERIQSLVALGYWPLKIKAVHEGDIVPVRNALMTLTNTVSGFGWCVGYVESLLLKVWNTSTIATYSLKLRKLVTKFALKTCDDLSHLPFTVHDFSYRGVSSEESAAIGGGSHLLNFFGTDTLPAIPFLQKYYGATGVIGLSVPATEHSVMCAYTPEYEFDGFNRMIDLYPNGIFSVVSDTYNLWTVLTEYAPQLKDRILAREGKMVFRPDSGDPLKIICGDPDAEKGSAESRGALNILGDTFGYTINSKGFKVLDPHVGLIYGDGFFYERFEMVLEEMARQGWASSNLVVGIGGLLVQHHDRDEFGFAIKATFGRIKGHNVELFKDPITDKKKQSHKGLLKVTTIINLDRTRQWITEDQVTEFDEQDSYLKTVFEDGELFNLTNLSDIRHRITTQAAMQPLVLS